MDAIWPDQNYNRPWQKIIEDFLIEKLQSDTLNHI